MENFGKFMAVVLAIILSPLIRGFVVLKMWGWFVVPVFSIQPIRIVEAIGLIFIIDFIKMKRDEKEDKDDYWTQLGKTILFLIAYSGIALLSGWIVSLFM